MKQRKKTFNDLSQLSGLITLDQVIAEHEAESFILPVSAITPKGPTPKDWIYMKQVQGNTHKPGNGGNQ